MQMGVVLLFFLFIFCLHPSKYYAEVYNITSSQPLAQGQVLVSTGHLFEFGFFDGNKYVGIWHKNVSPSKVVWVANREKPVTDTLSSLRISSNGNLELVDGKQEPVWSTNVTTQASSSNSTTSAAVLLLESGNLVVKNSMGDVVWQSFDYPGDTILPSMLIGFDSKSGKRKFLTSWKGGNDPSEGMFLVGLESQTPTQVFIWTNNGSTPYWRSGPWDRTKFIGLPEMDYQYQSGFKLDDDPTQGTKYFSYTLLDNTISYIDISSKGVLNLMLSENGSNWDRNWGAPDTPCDRYGVCGPFGVCKTSRSPMCKCLENFEPRSHEEWSKQNWTRGCVRRTELVCDSNTNKSVSSKGSDDGFQKMVRLKVPDFHEYITSLNSEECRMYCLNNCSCQAYAFVDTIGCLVWSRDLIDMQEFSAGGTDIFIRLAHADLGERKQIKLIASLTAICFISILGSIVFGWHRLQGNKKGTMKAKMKFSGLTGATVTSMDPLQEYIREHDQSELFIYDFECILIATNSFSDTNKLGEGGFGPVYKGKLQDGKEIAVKRLSSSSGQGIEEFKNEMLLISKLQHKNLVKILGCCVKEDEKLLIYEFMPNKSLDTLIFDPKKRVLLDWAARFNIIRGVARGLLYLHHDSCLKVIHRDLKVSNILLDEKMNPKISDFGLARIVEGAQNLVNTHKVVGTLGYISPEYAMGGIFSEKSDVYSFGVLLLEIISGQKNTSFYCKEQQLGFLPYAWHLWSEGRGLELADEDLNCSYSSSELLRCLHIGLLCVQDSAADRPTMPDVVFMLSSTVTDGPLPKRPIFTFQSPVCDPQPQYVNAFSANEATISVIEGR